MQLNGGDLQSGKIKCAFFDSNNNPNIRTVTGIINNQLTSTYSMTCSVPELSEGNQSILHLTF